MSTSETFTRAVDTPAQSAARAWLEDYGIRTRRYVEGGGDHPAMRTLPEAFDAYAARATPDPRIVELEAEVERLREALNRAVSRGCDHCAEDIRAARAALARSTKGSSHD
ncbi:hypothetical protein [Mangrovibrevibacter kandeliae]|uniref:hypothetical protein n=1 Tax=Mangrovibrevibacter kandeliae TaxID=2968473 RepID=UPI002119A118|nr:hypothetical protein [Aurantimonas sp. CSK15Z-1]MCQ8781703.1 hypothetical protein [Aurantimonas sp. CSK15Z-1]